MVGEPGPCHCSYCITTKSFLDLKRYIAVPIEGRKTKIDICVPFNGDMSATPEIEDDAGTSAIQTRQVVKVYLATVDLSKLGRKVKSGVRKGKIKDVYVLRGLSDDEDFDA